MTVSIADQIKSVGREIGMRRNVYPKWVAQGRMTQADADAEIAAMEAAYATLKWVDKHRARLIEMAPDLAANAADGERR